MSDKPTVYEHTCRILDRMGLMMRTNGEHEYLISAPSGEPAKDPRYRLADHEEPEPRNPERVEVGQVWRPAPGVCPDGWLDPGGTLTVRRVRNPNARGDREVEFGEGRCFASAERMLNPASGWRCIGIETSDGRVMVGERRRSTHDYHAGDVAEVVAVRAEGRVVLRWPGGRVNWPLAEEVAGWPLVPSVAPDLPAALDEHEATVARELRPAAVTIASREDVERMFGNGAIDARWFKQPQTAIYPIGIATSDSVPSEKHPGCHEVTMELGPSIRIPAPRVVATHDRRVGDVYALPSGRFEVTAFQCGADDVWCAIGVLSPPSESAREAHVFVGGLSRRQPIVAGWGPNVHGEPHPLRPLLTLLAVCGRVAVRAEQEERRREIMRMLDADRAPFACARRAAVMAACEAHPALDRVSAMTVCEVLNTYEQRRGSARRPSAEAIAYAKRMGDGGEAVSVAFAVYERERAR